MIDRIVKLISVYADKTGKSGNLSHTVIAKVMEWVYLLMFLSSFCIEITNGNQKPRSECKEKFHIFVFYYMKFMYDSFEISKFQTGPKYVFHEK